MARFLLQVHVDSEERPKAVGSESGDVDYDLRLDLPEGDAAEPPAHWVGATLIASVRRGAARTEAGESVPSSVALSTYREVLTSWGRGWQVVSPGGSEPALARRRPAGDPEAT